MALPDSGPVSSGGAWDVRLPWAAAVLGFAFALAAFYPGYMSWDSAYQWWQARHGRFDSVHPPLMAMLWQLTGTVLPGPGGLFALQQALLWGAYACIATALPWRGWQRALLVLALGLWPPLLGLSAHLWKDLWTLCGFAWAAGLLLHELHRPARARRVAVFVAVAAACAFRANAITGALPFLAWLAWREAALAPRRTGPAGVAAGALALTVVVALLSQLPGLDPRVRRVDSVWSVVTLWDAAGVSLREGRLVYPALLADPGLRLEELRASFREDTNTTVFETGKLRHSFDRPYAPAERAALHRLAWTLPTRYPGSYFRHRLRLAALLYGFDQPALPDYLVFSPGLHAYGDNPAVSPRRTALNAWLQPALQALVDTPLFAAWIYLAAAVAVAVAGFRRDAPPLRRAAGALAASALCYALPLALVSGSAEFRYLAWPLFASGLACVLALAGSAGRAPP